MRTRIHLLAVAVLVSIAFVACSGPTNIEDHPCPPEGTTATYENFGKAFIDSNCQSCHASHAFDRAGAPGDYFFDTQPDVYRHRARIFARAADTNTSMPPGPNDPPAADRERLADWLACGAK